MTDSTLPEPCGTVTDGPPNGGHISKKNRYIGPGVSRPYRGVPEQADRLTLITEWHHLVPERPVLVQAGETVWIEDHRLAEHRRPQYHLMVKRNSGQLDSYPGELYR
ncbi:hypothetical protein FBZ33_0155 [Micromonospora sp. A202]|jgi:hypothetical protein|nr:hypothetical protein FBZ33_0155 [Micromonospora sp. A202]